MHRNRFSIFAAAFIGILATSTACSSDPTSSPALRPGATHASAAVSASHHYLPYGVPIATGKSINAGPEPYDPAKHGPFSSNSMPSSANVAATAGVKHAVPTQAHALRAPSDTSPPPDVNNSDGNYTFYFTAGQGRGIYARNSAGRNVDIPAGWSDALLYAPTHLPAGGSCIEQTTVHKSTHQPSGYFTTHFGGWWDWCNGGQTGYSVLEPMDGTWASKYIRTMTDSVGRTVEVYYVQVYADHPNYAPGTSDCWRGLIYNFNTGLWESKLLSCGTTKRGALTGWTMWESYKLVSYQYGAYCPTIANIQAGELQILTASPPPFTSGIWQDLDLTTLGPSHNGNTCWDQAYSMHVTSDVGAYITNNVWSAWTPNP